MHESLCVVFDEIEKALAGFGGRATAASRRGFLALLTWLSDRSSDTFVVGTCNDISKTAPEFSRAERWEGVFFLDFACRSRKDL